jgi:hypothetical protein
MLYLFENRIIINTDVRENRIINTEFEQQYRTKQTEKIHLIYNTPRVPRYATTAVDDEILYLGWD